MKKILLSSLVVIMLIILFVTISNGVHAFNVPGIKEVSESSNNLTQKIGEAKELSTTQYDNAISELNTAKASFQKEKQNYDELLSYSSKQDYTLVGQETKYPRETIWIKLGVYAKENNLKVKYEFVETNTLGKYDINFTVVGQYIEIIDFIYSIEDDDDLKFIVENLTMIPAENNNVQATFKTSNVTIL